jgi:hypothetical protein
MNNIPESFIGSKALQFIMEQGWEFKVSTPPNIELQICPICKNSSGNHFYMELHGPSDGELVRRDSLWSCHRCGASGNLYSLREKLGLTIPGIQSRSEWAEQTLEPLPNIAECHQALLEDEVAMDYLVNTRGFSRAIIEKQKLGLTKRHFKECAEVPALIYPYFVGSNVIFCHFRTLPPSPKAFNSPRGYDVPLYNGEILKEGIKEVIFFEGEANTICALDKGLINVCGVPGANIKKASWIDTLDRLESLEKIYICYDKDRNQVGSKAASSLASRIGIEKCWKITLPNFEIITETGETRKGKDLNEFFQHGGTIEQFEKLKEEAVLFDVDGVTNSGNAIQEFEDLINERGGLAPKYLSPWPSLNKLVGFEEGDVIDITAEEKIGKTTVAMNLVEHMVDTYNEVACIICAEMPIVRQARKWIAHICGIADNIPKTPEEATKLKEEFLTNIPFAKEKVAKREGDLLFCYPRYQSLDDIYKLIIAVIRRYGATWIVVDNMQLLCDNTIGGKNRTIHLSELSKNLAKIAKDYNVKIVRIVQPHQIKPGQMATSKDADGSSQIAKDCDCSIVLHRNRINEISVNDFSSLSYVESDSSFDEKMLVTVGLSRYHSGGYVTLRFDGARSTVSEYNMGEIAAIKAMAERDVGYDSQLQKLGAMIKPVPEGEVTI